MKIKIKDKEYDLTWEEAKSIHDQYRIECIKDWIEGIEINHEGTTQDITEEEREELAKEIFAYLEKDKQLEENISESERDALEYCATEKKYRVW